MAKRKKSTAKKPTKKHESKKKRKANAKKTRSRAKATNRSRKTERKKVLSKKKQLRSKKPSRKNVRKSKVSVQVQRTRTNRKRTKQSAKSSRRKVERIDGQLQVEKQTIKTNKQITYAFSGVRAVDKKIKLFQAKGKTAIEKQLKKFGGKPPRGFVVTVRDKKGREHSVPTPLDFVVNENSIQDFISNMLKQMKEDFMEWSEMDDMGEEPADDDENPYKDYNPDTIHEITIRFIYAPTV